MFSNLYVYAIAKIFALPDITGINEEKLFRMEYSDIAAIVSRADFEEIDPTKRNVQSHVRAQEQLMLNQTVLPLGFGTIVPQEKICGILQKNYSAILGELARFSDKIEVEVKMSWNRDILVAELEQSSSQYMKVKKELEKVKSLIRKQELILEIGKLVEKKVEEWKETYAKTAFGTLKERCFDAKENSTSRVDILLDISFLIHTQDEKEFLRSLNEVDGKIGGRLNFKFIGPLPPYNFLTLKLEM